MSDKMDTVAEVAKMSEQHSARELSTSQQSHKQKCAQLDQLTQFKVDYESALVKKGNEGMPARQLQDYRLFLGKLTQAIDKQRSDIEDSKVSLASVHAQWLAKSQRKSALEHLVEERHKTRMKIRDKAEQKASDEHTMNRQKTVSEI